MIYCDVTNTNKVQRKTKQDYGLAVTEWINALHGVPYKTETFGTYGVGQWSVYMTAENGRVFQAHRTMANGGKAVKTVWWTSTDARTFCYFDKYEPF